MDDFLKMGHTTQGCTVGMRYFGGLVGKSVEVAKFETHYEKEEREINVPI